MKQTILFIIIILACFAGIAFALGGLDMGLDLDIDSNPAIISSPPPSAFILPPSAFIFQAPTFHTRA